MGICLDTEQSDGSQAFEEGRDTWAKNSGKNVREVATPAEGRFPMHNNANLQFETPKVPVIFVLGGPGSGKVTHCDNLMQEKYGIVHINMTDLLQQYAIGNDMQDFSQLSSKTVTEVLMLEMKMAPTAKTYLVSGYPRNMRDVVEYSEKIQIINGVILISWRQKVLERQIDYGAKLGQVVLSLARMELNNFYKQVMPVADYFDQNNMLISVNGERHPQEVYKDFKSAVMKILGTQDNPPVFSNGPEASLPNDVTTTELPAVPAKITQIRPASQIRPETQVLSMNGNIPHRPTDAPPVLWVLGGPGSNKAMLCEQAAKDTGWMHVSMGKLLRIAAEDSDKKVGGSEARTIKESISNGDLVPNDIVMRMVESHVLGNVGAEGVIVDGFPRDLTQATEFEAKFKQKPTVILLDCSKLQLGRGKLDDSITAFRRRLEVFRQSTLPMLKAMDNIGRLTIVDGDTEFPHVQNDFKQVVKDHVDYITGKAPRKSHVPTGNRVLNGLPNGISTTNHVNATPNGHAMSNGTISNGHIANGDTIVHDLEPTAIETISHSVSNGVKEIANGHGPKMVIGVANGVLKNKYADLDADRQDNIRQLYGGLNATNHI
ncbi:adenylate kinase isoenzyme 5 [Onthophagus taurus]|uniref:adenylate kinase isoenzyme 5 n=1 Tax=Onthophagus taurus TaxID=166361 RepID=UPI000C1FF9E1|nr:adenylate kinase isoenzyme 5 [Onthophagus taurus]